MTRLRFEKLSTQRLPLITIGRLALVISLVTAVAFAGDRTIINGSSCKVTEEDFDLDVCVPCTDCIPPTLQPADPGGCYHLKDVYLRVDFPDPDSTKPGTHWRFGRRNDGRTGLRLVDVSVKAAQLDDLKYVIKDAGMADIYVPYDNGSNRYYDMQFTTPDDLDQVEKADLASELSSLVYLRRKTSGYYADDAIPRVGIECRDSGFAWSCKNHSNPSEDIRRRLHEVVLWAVSDAGNYDNTIEYRFREDGSIGFRYGPTGFDSVSHKGISHVHDALWRVSTKLFGETTSEVRKFRHVDQHDGTFSDSEDSVPKETSILWEPLEFTSLIVQSTARENKYGHLMGYEFAPWNRTGTARQSTDQWTLNDYYLTNDNPGEDGFGIGSPYDWRVVFHSPDVYLSSFLNNETLGATGDGVVLWYISSAHHEPSDTDNQPGSGEYTGVTPVHWNGFDMEPHNFFEYNPVGGPAMCYP